MHEEMAWCENLTLATQSHHFKRTVANFLSCSGGCMLHMIITNTLFHDPHPNRVEIFHHAMKKLH